MKALLLLIAALPLTAAETVFNLDPAQTTVAFTLHDVLHTVHGTFKLKRSALHFDPETNKAAGEIIVDVASGDSGSQGRDKRMHKEILESKKFPEASFVPDRVEGKLAPDGPSELDFHGQFSIHGASHEMSLHFHVEGKAGQYTGSSHFVIPYVQWGMKNPSNFLLKVDDKVDLDLKVAARSAP